MPTPKERLTRADRSGMVSAWRSGASGGYGMVSFLWILAGANVALATWRMLGAIRERDMLAAVECATMAAAAVTLAAVVSTL